MSLVTEHKINSGVSKRLKQIHWVSFNDIARYMIAHLRIMKIKQIPYDYNRIQKALVESFDHAYDNKIIFKRSDINEWLAYSWLEACVLHGLMVMEGHNMTILFPDEISALRYHDKMIADEQVHCADLPVIREMSKIFAKSLNLA